MSHINIREVFASDRHRTQHKLAPRIRQRWLTFPVALGASVLVTYVAHAAPEDVRRIEQAIEARVSHGQFMGAVLVARDGKVLLNKGYGRANLEWNVPNSPRTRYRLGSVTKQFTAACVLLLEERGRLKLEDPITRYMPDAPPAWTDITFFELLTHTSGIPELTRFPDFESTEPFPVTPEKLVARFRDKPLDFAPGSQFRYSNSGYILLGYLIEKITGQPYRQFVRENLLTPLGMKDTGYDSNLEIIERHAQGYARRANGLGVAGYIDMTLPFAAGGLYSSTEDLLRWEEALYGGRLLAPRSLAKMTAPNKEHYAFGIGVDRDGNGNRVFSHGGMIEGFGAYLIYVPAEKLAVIVLANVEGNGAHDLAHDLLRITGHEFPSPK